jgi:hypothetical protein
VTAAIGCWRDKAIDVIFYNELGARLVDVLPELRVAYEAECEAWEDEIPGAHVIYGDLLMPYLTTLLDRGEDAKLRQVFTFLELLAQSENVHIQEVVAFTVCESLLDDKARVEKARAYMGEATLRISHEVEAFWERMREGQTCQ